MARIDPIPLDQMTAAQRDLYERVAAAGRGAATGPWAALLHAPRVGEGLAEIVEYLMSETLLPHRLKRLAALVISRAYTAQYQWYRHEPRARAAGLDGAIIDAIRKRVRPAFRDPSEALVYDVTSEIVYGRALSDDLYGRVVDALGEAGVIELVTLVGFYVAIAVLLVAHDVETPDGAAPPLDP